MARSVTKQPQQHPQIASADVAVNALAAIRKDASITHSSDLRLLVQSRQRLEFHREHLQATLRLVEDQIENYDRMIQMANTRAKELS